jgi:hypothetical protein
MCLFDQCLKRHTRYIDVDLGAIGTAGRDDGLAANLTTDWTATTHAPLTGHKYSLFIQIRFRPPSIGVRYFADLGSSALLF